MNAGSVLLLASAGLGLLAGCSTIQVKAAEVPPTLTDLIKDYRTWHKVNPAPIQMEPYFVALCSGPPSWQLGGNPHDPKFFTVYVNPVGREAMLRKGSTKFSEGTIIVKEKAGSAKSAKIELLTVMVKRKPGFDAKHGDWEYFTAKGDGTETSQKDIQKCQSCHEVNKANDYVFRNYVLGSAQPARRFGRPLPTG